MNYLRKTVPSNIFDSIFDLPSTLRNTKVEVIILPIEQVEAIPEKPSRKFDFVSTTPLPESFFDPLPEEELQAWGL